MPGGQQPEAERPPDAGEAVDRDRTDRVVDPPALEEVDAERDNDPGDGSDHDRPEG